MLNVKTSRWPLVWEKAVHLVVSGDVFDDVFLWCPFFHDMPLMRSGT